MRTYLTEVSNRDWMQEAMALRGYPLEPMDGWDDIATAPRDGTLIRVRQRQWAPCHAKFDGEHWHFTEFTSFEPTHWQLAPLRTPPSPKPSGEE